MLVIIFSLVVISAVALLVQLYFFEKHKKYKLSPHGTKETNFGYPFEERRKQNWGPAYPERRRSAA